MEKSEIGIGGRELKKFWRVHIAIRCHCFKPTTKLSWSDLDENEYQKMLENFYCFVFLPWVLRVLDGDDGSWRRTDWRQNIHEEEKEKKGGRVSCGVNWERRYLKIKEGEVSICERKFTGFRDGHEHNDDWCKRMSKETIVVAGSIVTWYAFPASFRKTQSGGNSSFWGVLADFKDDNWNCAFRRSLAFLKWLWFGVSHLRTHVTSMIKGRTDAGELHRGEVPVSARIENTISQPMYINLSPLIFTRNHHPIPRHIYFDATKSTDTIITHLPYLP